MNTRIAVIGAGGMGSAIAARLADAGAEVLTSLVGRSNSSRQRAASAGMHDVGDEGLTEAEVILSVVPPDQAMPVAERLAPALKRASRKPVYVDCNAISPERAIAIEHAMTAAGTDFVDAGIIGLPPRPGTPGPTVFLSGPQAARVAMAIDPYGVRTHVLALPNGAASALKMAYAGITKGLIALAATMAIAAQRAGIGDALVAELASSQPNLFASFTKSVPDMLTKAPRWVPEMEEIRQFIGDGTESGAAYGTFARFYKQITDAPDLQHMLGDFYKAPEPDAGP